MNISSIYANVTRIASVEGIRQTHMETERKRNNRSSGWMPATLNIVMKGPERCILAARDKWYFNSKAQNRKRLGRKRDKTPRMNQQGPPFFIQNKRNREVVEVGGGEMFSKNPSNETTEGRENGSQVTVAPPAVIVRSHTFPLSHGGRKEEKRKKKKNMQEVHVIHRDIRESLDSVRGKIRV